MESMFLTPIRLNELEILIENSVDRVLEKHRKKPAKEPVAEELLTPKEARGFLKTSAPTLWRLEKAGKVKVYGIGGKRYFKRSELLNSLEEIRA